MEREQSALRDYIQTRLRTPNSISRPASPVAGAWRERRDRLADVFERALGGARRRPRSPPARGGNRTSRSWPSRGVIMTSGGSPASRARVMRSCMMLKASTITRRNAGAAAAPPTNWRLSERSAPKMRAKPRRSGTRCSGGCVSSRRSRRSAMIDAAAEEVGVEIDRDDEARAEHARRRHRHRIDQRAVDQPAAVERDRRENSGQRIGGAHRVDQPAARQPDFVAGADLGGDGGEADRQSLDRRVAELLFQPRRELACRRSGRRRSG